MTEKTQEFETRKEKRLHIFLEKFPAGSIRSIETPNPLYKAYARAMDMEPSPRLFVIDDSLKAAWLPDDAVAFIEPGTDAVFMRESIYKGLSEGKTLPSYRSVHELGHIKQSTEGELDLDKVHPTTRRRMLKDMGVFAGLPLVGGTGAAIAGYKSVHSDSKNRRHGTKIAAALAGGVGGAYATRRSMARLIAGRTVYNEEMDADLQATDAMSPENMLLAMSEELVDEYKKVMPKEVDALRSLFEERITLTEASQHRVCGDREKALAWGIYFAEMVEQRPWYEKFGKQFKYPQMSQRILQMYEQLEQVSEGRGR